MRFRTSTAHPVGGQPADVAVADLNDDGALDLVVTNFNVGTTSILLGDGSGDFIPNGDFPSAMAPTQIAVADFDRDGTLDLMLSETESDFIYYLRGLGEGAFDTQRLIASGHDPAAVVAADMNEDGILDVVVSIASEGTGGVNVLLGDGMGNFARLDPGADPNTPDRVLPVGCFSVAVLDVNGDEHLDVLAVTLNGLFVVLTGDGTGGLNRDPTPRSIGVNLFHVAAADLNGDGHVDAVVTDSGNSEVIVMTGDGSGAFTRSAAYPAGNGVATVEIVDLDGDGVRDLLTANTAGGDVSVYPGRADGTFGTARTYAAPLRTYAAASGDFDGDGRMDIVAVHGDPDAADILFGRPGGFDAIESLPRMSGAAGIAAGDLNGDGVPDLVVATGNGGEIAWVPSTPDPGGFGARQAIPGNVRSGALRLVDLDGDGRLDIVTADIEQPDVFVILAGASGFGTPVRHEIAGAAQALAVADLDGDGHLDIAAAVGNAQVISRLYGAGDGSFTPAEAVATSARPSSLAVGDFDRDGIADLVVGNTNGLRAQLLLGRADRSLETSHSLDTGGAPFAVAVTDADNDERDDVLALVGNQLRVFFGADDLTFDAGQRINAAGIAVAARDVTGDRQPEVLIANQIGNAVTILPNIGSRTFGAPVAYSPGLRPLEVVAADFDADGRYDVAARGSGTWVLTNAAAVAVPARGDANGDGRISAADLIPLAAALRRARTQAVERAANLLEHATTAVDVNGDGEVDPTDLPLLLTRLFTPAP